VISTPFARIVSIFAIIAFSTNSTGAWPHKNGQTLRVRFLATSTLIRGTFGQNEDIYLAQLILPTQGEEVLVRLVDAYPNEWSPFGREVLTSDSGKVLQVRRDFQCDRAFGDMPLRTAPGDFMAFMPEKLVYQPLLPRSPESSEIIPCYRIVRH
jgi:hypothetical protein